MDISLIYRGVPSISQLIYRGVPSISQLIYRGVPSISQLYKLLVIGIAVVELHLERE